MSSGRRVRVSGHGVEEASFMFEGQGSGVQGHRCGVQGEGCEVQGEGCGVTHRD